MKSLLFAISFLISIVCTAQLSVSGVNVPLVFKTDEQALILNGAGTREKYFMDMYVGALYLKSKTKDASAIQNSDETMCMKLHMVSSLITSEKMTTAVDEGFEKSSGGNISPLQARISQFKSVFAEKINKGDVYDLVYVKGKGTLVYKNSKLASTIPGLDFKMALFGIWLCDKPADAGLKKSLLGN